MRIGIDCRLAGPDHAGIGRYTAELVNNLLSTSNTIEWVLFCSNQQQAEYLIGSNKSKRVRAVICTIQHYSLAEQFLLPWIFYREKLDLLHVPHFNVPLAYRKPYFITIHDLLWHHHRGQQVTTLHPWIYWLKYLGYRLVASQAIKTAKHIFVPSEEIKQTLHQYYPTMRNKIEVTYEGVNLEPPQTLRKSLPKNYLLFVGSLYPHKNIAVVLKALQELPELQLVLVGSRSVFSQQIHQLVTTLDVEKQVTFFGRATEGELHTLYKNAYALVQPSLSEGFGLTGIEAMATGTPVIASDISIFHEVYQDAAVFCQPHDPKSFVQAIQQLPKHSKDLRALGLKLSKQYSWQKMASATLSAYQRFLAHS